MNTSYHIFKNKSTLEVRKIYKDKHGAILDVSRIPAYVVGNNSENLYENARGILYSTFNNDKYLTEESYPNIDREAIYDTLLSKLDENHSRRDKIYTVHIFAFIMSGFNYSRNAIADMLGVHTQAIYYMLNIVQQRISINDAQTKKLIDSLPEDIQSYIYRIYNDNIIYEY